MKRIIIALIAGAVALTFAACNTPTSDVKWKTLNASSIGTADNYITDIAWKSGGSVDQTWGEQLDGSSVTETSYKSVTEFTGEGDCVDSDGTPFSITIDNSSTNIVSTSGGSAVIKEDASVELVIQTVSVK